MTRGSGIISAMKKQKKGGSVPAKGIDSLRQVIAGKKGGK